MLRIPKDGIIVHQKHTNLLKLLTYAQHHAHSAAWIPAIFNILARLGVTRG
jgi:hypothetical protein